MMITAVDAAMMALSLSKDEKNQRCKLQINDQWDLT
jgi:hypothetical protein